MAKTCVNFTAAQVLAALNGETVVYREAVKPQPSKEVIAVDNVGNGEFVPVIFVPNRPFGIHLPFGIKCPYGEVGHRLWVCETWHYDSHMHELTDGVPDAPDGRYLHRLVYRADSPDWQAVGGWKSPAIMPRWASRLNMRITAVSVERVDGGWEWAVEMVKAVQE